MSRTIRSESFVNEHGFTFGTKRAPVQSYALATQSERSAWAATMARRTIKRAAVRNADPRAQSGSVLANVLFSVAIGVAGAASLFLSLAA